MPEEVYSQPVNQSNSSIKKNLVSGILILIGGIVNILYILVPALIGGVFILPSGLGWWKLFPSLGLFIEPWLVRLVFGISGISFLILGILVYKNKSKLYGILSFVISVYDILISGSIGLLANLLAIGPYLAILGGFLALISKTTLQQWSTKKIISITLAGLLIAFGLYIPLIYRTNSMLSSVTTNTSASVPLNFGKLQLYVSPIILGSDGNLTLSIKNNEDGPITLTGAAANLDGNDIVWTFISIEPTTSIVKEQNIPSGDKAITTGIVSSGNWIAHNSFVNNSYPKYSTNLTIYYTYNGQNLSSTGTISGSYIVLP